MPHWSGASVLGGVLAEPVQDRHAGAEGRDVPLAGSSHNSAGRQWAASPAAPEGIMPANQSRPSAPNGASPEHAGRGQDPPGQHRGTRQGVRAATGMDP